MMEQIKPASSGAPPTSEATSQQRPTATYSVNPSVIHATAEERVHDLERRLNMLGVESGASAPSTKSVGTSSGSDTKNNTISAPAKPAQTGKNNPLLKRIQAAQERARLAEQKEKDAKAAAAAELKRNIQKEEQVKLNAEEEARIQKAQLALRSVAGRALEDKQKEILRQLEGKEEEQVDIAWDQRERNAMHYLDGAAVRDGNRVPPAATAGIPIMKSLDIPPPSFDSMKFPPPPMPPGDEMVGHGMNSRVLQPADQTRQQLPSFHVAEEQMMIPTVEQVAVQPSAPELWPTAPPMTMGANHFQGIMPVAPPVSRQHTQVEMPPPPSFAEFEQQILQQSASAAATSASAEQPAVDDEGIFDYDIEGNPVSAEKRQALLDEQRRLYASIMQENAANEVAIAQASANAFDQRSSSAAARVMEDQVGQHISESTSASAGEANVDHIDPPESRRLVKIGNNQTVALHGQERTKKAIKEGTAILVQCINCQNWMQVTDTATLMFCPVCSTVCPVIKQDEVLTKEEAIQLTMDRKLAEKLQADAYAEREKTEAAQVTEGGFFERLGGGILVTTDSIVQTISGLVSYGVSEETTQVEQDTGRGELGVTRPPGASSSSSTYPGQRRARASVNNPTSSSAEETRGLLSPVVIDGDNGANLPAARVAESKPLFSCVMDSVNSAASAVFSSGTEDAHGADASSLLMTNAGRGVGDGACDYEALPDR